MLADDRHIAALHRRKVLTRGGLFLRRLFSRAQSAARFCCVSAIAAAICSAVLIVFLPKVPIYSAAAAVVAAVLAAAVVAAVELS